MAARQVLFFLKNIADYSNPNVVITASQGQDYAERCLDRSNATAWQTTDSVDADNTSLEIDLVDTHAVTDILLVNHNFKAFTIQYWDGSAYQNFSSSIAETNNTDSTTNFNFTEVQTSKIKLIITGTQTANSDKTLDQFIITKRIGRLTGWPIIKAPSHTRNLAQNLMLSGKSQIVQNVGSFSATLAVKNWNSDADLTIIETLYRSSLGFLVWLSGGDENQFATKRQGYRKQDIYLMQCVDDYTPEYVEGLYRSGLRIEMSLTEVTQ